MVPDEEARRSDDDEQQTGSRPGRGQDMWSRTRESRRTVVGDVCWSWDRQETASGRSLPVAMVRDMAMGMFSKIRWKRTQRGPGEG